MAYDVDVRGSNTLLVVSRLADDGESIVGPEVSPGRKVQSNGFVVDASASEGKVDLRRGFCSIVHIDATGLCRSIEDVGVNCVAELGRKVEESTRVLRMHRNIGWRCRRYGVRRSVRRCGLHCDFCGFGIIGSRRSGVSDPIARSALAIVSVMAWSSKWTRT